MGELERVVRVRPAYDCLIQPCGKNGCGERQGASHGRHNAELHMVLRGERAEVVMCIGTGWDLPETPPSFRSSTRSDAPRGLVVEFHSADPQYDGHDPRGGQCDLWTPCYWNASYSMADEPAELLVREGSDAVWAWLDTQHRETFGGTDA